MPEYPAGNVASGTAKYCSIFAVHDAVVSETFVRFRMPFLCPRFAFYRALPRRTSFACDRSRRARSLHVVARLYSRERERDIKEVGLATPIYRLRKLRLILIVDLAPPLRLFGGAAESSR
eukprot:6186933-Pleurochrysis_carterae.AAC.1